MNILPARLPSQQDGEPLAQPTTQPYTFAAPSRGLTLADNIAMAKPGGALVLDNIFPQDQSAKARGGLTQRGRIATAEAVKAFMSYQSGGVQTLFAATATNVYDVTSPVDPNVIPAASLASTTSGDWSCLNFTNAGGNFLIAVNGSDQRQLFDGSSWSTSPGITGGPGTNGNLFCHVWGYQSHVWFIQKNTLSAWYLGVDAIGGAATELNLGAIFERGGKLVFGTSFSFDSGAGVTEFCAFVTDQGEVAVYTGISPDDASTWLKVGQCYIGEPMGRLVAMRAGSDVLIATKLGDIPLSVAMSKDVASLSAITVSRQVMPLWRNYVANRLGDWSVVKVAALNMGIVIIPATGGQQWEQLVVNLQSGAWCRYTGWKATCGIEFNGRLYIGTADGLVCEAESGGSDLGANYQVAYVGLHESLGSSAVEKSVRMARGTFRASTNFNATVSISTNYGQNLESYPSVATQLVGDAWDAGLWDVAVWDSGGVQAIQTDWVAVAGEGFAIAPNVQITCGSVVKPEIEIIAIDVLYEAGAVMA